MFALPVVRILPDCLFIVRVQCVELKSHTALTVLPDERPAYCGVEPDGLVFGQKDYVVQHLLPRREGGLVFKDQADAFLGNVMYVDVLFHIAALQPQNLDRQS